MKKIYLFLIALLLTLGAGAQTIPGWKSTNTAHSSTSSTTYVLVVGAGSTLTFDWEVGSESNYDWFIVTLDGSEKIKKSGNQSGNYTCEFATAGTHTLVAKYTKDSSNSYNGDYGKIYNINLTTPAAPSIPAGKRGDVDGDGIVDVADVTEIVDIILNSDKEELDARAVDLGLSVKWASCNVGATAPEEYGGYYAWGETEEKNNYSWGTYKYCNGSEFSQTKYCANSTFGTVDGKTTLDPEDDVAHVKWGGAWRMPTNEEQQELIKNCTWEWTTSNGVKGYRVTGPNGNSIFLPAAGMYSGSSIKDLGGLIGTDYGYYHSSSCHSGYSSSPYTIFFYQGYNKTNYDYTRDYGRSVRPVCE